jgi:hypothetical protein
MVNGMRLALVFALLACSSAEGDKSEPLLDAAVTDTGVAESATDTGVFDVPTPPLDTGMCVATEMVEKTCNGKDDDCNGAIDDVDVGKDGICDCLGVLILGSAGANPASAFEVWLKGKGTTTKRRLDSAGGPLTAAELTGIDVVILDRLSRDYTAAEIEVLQSWVKAGGGLIAMTGYDHSGADATRPNGILAGLGATYDATIKPGGPVTDWDATHPIARDMTSVTFAGGYAVAPVTGFKTAVVARSAGNPVAIAVDTSMGRVFVWGDEWIEYDSEWSTLPAIPKLWANIFGWVVQRKCGVKIF